MNPLHPINKSQLPGDDTAAWVNYWRRGAAAAKAYRDENKAVLERHIPADMRRPTFGRPAGAA